MQNQGSVINAATAWVCATAAFVMEAKFWLRCFEASVVPAKMVNTAAEDLRYPEVSRTLAVAIKDMTTRPETRQFPCERLVRRGAEWKDSFDILKMYAPCRRVHISSEQVTYTEAGLFGTEQFVVVQMQQKVATAIPCCLDCVMDKSHLPAHHGLEAPGTTLSWDMLHDHLFPL